MNIQQLRAQIDALQDATMDENKNFRSAYEEGKFDALSAVDVLLDSLQEEPKFKTGNHIKPIDSSLGAPRTILEVCDGWYVTNQGTLDFEFEDNWELVEEPVSVWHDTIDMPDKEKKILVVGFNGEAYAGYYNGVCNPKKIKHWAYIDELLKL